VKRLSLAALVVIPLAPAAGWTQAVNRLPAPAPARIVVYQFTSDLGHQALATGVARSLVRALRVEPAFQVMTHPRGARGGHDAEFAVTGHVAAEDRGVRVTVQLLEISRVALLARESVVVPDRDGPAVTDEVVAVLVARLRQHFARRPAGIAR
jgi:TolB-like protein